MFEGCGKTSSNLRKVLSVYASDLFLSVWNHSLSFDILGGDSQGIGTMVEEESEKPEVSGKCCENSAVFSSLPMAIKWLRDSVLQQNRSIRLQVRIF